MGQADKAFFEKFEKVEERVKNFFSKLGREKSKAEALKVEVGFNLCEIKVNS